jgi:GntR family transcriptional regulator
VKVDFHSGEPVYKQIVQSLKGDIISGKLSNNEAIPSIRELARDLNINPNTVARAYRELESEGYIYTRPGVGNFIKQSDEKTMETKALEMLGNELIEIINTARSYKLPRKKFAEFVMQTIDNVYGGDE